MTEPLELVAIRAQKTLQSAPVIVLGSGASAAYDIPGMGRLRDHLLESIRPLPEDPGYEVWEAFKRQLASDDLETSLQKVQLNEHLVRAVIRETWKLINAADLNVFENVVRGSQTLGLTTLYKYLFGSVHKTLSVVTTNYDRLAEYAADAGDFAHHTGFAYGYLRYRDSAWRVTRGGAIARTVEVCKVHGSLDWFMRPDETLVALPLGPSIPEGFVPTIVTPGVTKYQIAYREPFRSSISSADAALHKAPSYLCVGYGFNDEHIQPKLIERIHRDSVPIVVLAQTLTTSAKKCILEGRCKEYLALEADTNEGTRAYLPEFPDGVVIEGQSLWNLDAFLSLVVLEPGRNQYATV